VFARPISDAIRADIRIAARTVSEPKGQGQIVTSEKASAGAVTATIGFSVLALLFYAIALATLADLASSDMAGNAYAQVFSTIEVTILWLLLAVITIIAGVKGVMPVPAGLAAALLIPASGFVTIEALELLARPEVKPFLWPLVIPAAIPPLVVAFCFWSLLPKIRAAIPAGIAGGIVWGGVLVLCLAIVPLMQIRQNAKDQFAAGRAKYAEDFAKLTADAPL
jgi:hypothetical protein